VKKIMFLCCTVLLGLALLTGLLPAFTYAAGSELVLTKIGHTSSDSVSITNASTRSVKLTVPFSYAGNTLDLSTGLIIEKAPAIDSVITSFNTGVLATVGDAGTAGPPVSMSVAYYKGGNSAVQYSTSYNISIVRAARVEPTFTGTIAKTITDVMPNSKINDITFSSSEFSCLYTANDGGPITGVSITGSSLSCGALKIGGGSSYVNYVSGKPVAMNDIGSLVFDAVSSGTVFYLVSAYAGDDMSKPIGSVLLTITVNGITVPVISGPVSKTINAGSSYTFSLSDFSSQANLKGGTPDSIEITPAPTGAGVWLNSSAPFTGTTVIPSSAIGNLKFSANEAGTAAFTWRVSNEAGFSDYGSGTITVKSIAKPVITSSVVKSVNLGATLVFSLSDFSSCYSLNNGTLKDIVITPSKTDCGTWYKGSAAFTGAKTFNKNDISTLKFKAAQCGQAAFTWTVSNEKGASAKGSGLITVNAVAATISYSTDQNTVKKFSASDFNAACKEATGAGLDYICFSLPPAACGTLCYGYSSSASPGTAVTSNTALYYGKAPRISDVTFVPAADYTGTFTISYTGVNTKDIVYTGEIKITVGNAGDVSYHAAQNSARTFDASDFNRACMNMTGASLSYVYFTLPSLSSGTLYYGYASPLSPGTAVSPNSLYSTQDLSYVTFVPAANFAGTLSILYTGIASNNVSYTGYIRITVGGLGTVSYTTGENRAVWLLGADFNTACINLTGSRLHSVRLLPPSVSEGRLFYNYSSVLNRGSAVSPDTPYYLDNAPYIGYVAFVPAADFSGTAYITFLGYSTGGTQFTGNIAIKVNGRSGSAYFSDVGSSYEWAAGAIDYLHDAGIVLGTGGNQYTPGAAMTRGDFLLMLHRAMGYTASTKSNFSDVPKGSYYYDAIAIAKSLGIAKGTDNKIGPATPLTRQDAMVYIYRALLVTGVKLTPGTSADLASFTDKGKVSKYALEAVQTLVKAGMIKGCYNRLNPGSVLSRAEMAVVLYRVKISF
jgi:hypothetical protein